MSENAYAVDAEILSEFVHESVEKLEHAEGVLCQERNASSEGIPFAEVVMAAQNIKGNAAFFNLMKVQRFARFLAESLQTPPLPGTPEEGEVCTRTLRAIKMLREMLHSAGTGGPEVLSEEAYQELLSELSGPLAAGRDARRLWALIEEEVGKVSEGSSRLKRLLTERSPACSDESIRRSTKLAASPEMHALVETVARLARYFGQL